VTDLSRLNLGTTVFSRLTQYKGVMNLSFIRNSVSETVDMKRAGIEVTYRTGHISPESFD